MKSNPEIFFSYAWGDESEQSESREKIVNELYEALKADGNLVRRDKYAVGYRELFSEFMKDMGKGKFIVIVISDKYLKSPYCMYELLEIYRKSGSDMNDMRKKIFPIILSDAKIRTPFDRLSYVAFWKAKKQELDEKINEVGMEYAAGAVKDFKMYREIAFNINELVDFVNDMNTLNPAILSAENFAEIKKTIASMAADDQISGGARVEPGADSKSAENKEKHYTINNEGAKIGQQNINSNVDNSGSSFTID